jgi:hypothetical protein
VNYFAAQQTYKTPDRNARYVARMPHMTHSDTDWVCGVLTKPVRNAAGFDPIMLSMDASDVPLSWLHDPYKGLNIDILTDEAQSGIAVSRHQLKRSHLNSTGPSASQTHLKITSTDRRGRQTL